MPAVSAVQAQESVGRDAAFEESFELVLYKLRQAGAGGLGLLEESGGMLLHLPAAWPTGWLNAARWPNASEPVLIAGHQPALGLVAAYLPRGDRRNRGRVRAVLLRSSGKISDPVRRKVEGS